MQITEIIVLPSYNRTPELNIRTVVNMAKRQLGVVNLIENDFTKNSPVIIFNGALSNEAKKQIINIINAHDYATVIFNAQYEQITDISCQN